MQERAEVQWKFRFALFSHPNSESEVDINFYYGFENHIYKPGKGFFRHV